MHLYVYTDFVISSIYFISQLKFIHSFLNIMKFFKISKSKMQALAKYLFRKCRTLQLNRSRDVTNFEILDFIGRGARQCVCVLLLTCVAATFYALA